MPVVLAILKNLKKQVLVQHMPILMHLSFKNVHFQLKTSHYGFNAYPIEACSSKRTTMNKSVFILEAMNDSNSLVTQF